MRRLSLLLVLLLIVVLPLAAQTTETFNSPSGASFAYQADWTIDTTILPNLPVIQGDGFTLAMMEPAYLGDIGEAADQEEIALNLLVLITTLLADHEVSVDNVALFEDNGRAIVRYIVPDAGLSYWGIQFDNATHMGVAVLSLQRSLTEDELNPILDVITSFNGPDDVADYFPTRLGETTLIPLDVNLVTLSTTFSNLSDVQLRLPEGWILNTDSITGESTETPIQVDLQGSTAQLTLLEPYINGIDAEACDPLVEGMADAADYAGLAFERGAVVSNNFFDRPGAVFETDDTLLAAVRLGDGLPVMVSVSDYDTLAPGQLNQVYRIIASVAYNEEAVFTPTECEVVEETGGDALETVTAPSGSFTVSYPADVFQVVTDAENTPDNITFVTDPAILNDMQIGEEDALIAADYGGSEALMGTADLTAEEVAEFQRDALLAAGREVSEVLSAELDNVTVYGFEENRPDRSIYLLYVYLDVPATADILLLTLVTSSESERLRNTSTVFRMAESVQVEVESDFALTEVFVHESENFTVPYPAGWRVAVETIGSSELVVVTTGNEYDINQPPVPGEPSAILNYGNIETAPGVEAGATPEEAVVQAVLSITEASVNELVETEIAGRPAAAVIRNREQFDNFFIGVMRDDENFIAANVFTAPGQDGYFLEVIIEMIAEAQFGTLADSGDETAFAPALELGESQLVGRLSLSLLEG